MAYGAQAYRLKNKRSSPNFASSPAAQHRRLALNCFTLAKKARAAGNSRHYWTMMRFGKKALALSKREAYLFKFGQSLRKRSFATQRALLARSS
jgi:hypothetical protein